MIQWSNDRLTNVKWIKQELKARSHTRRREKLFKSQINWKGNRKDSRRKASIDCYRFLFNIKPQMEAINLELKKFRFSSSVDWYFNVTIYCDLILEIIDTSKDGQWNRCVVKLWEPLVADVQTSFNVSCVD